MTKSELRSPLRDRPTDSGDVVEWIERSFNFIPTPLVEASLEAPWPAYRRWGTGGTPTAEPTWKYLFEWRHVPDRIELVVASEVGFIVYHGLPHLEYALGIPGSHRSFMRELWIPMYREVIARFDEREVLPFARGASDTD